MVGKAGRSGRKPESAATKRAKQMRSTAVSARDMQAPEEMGSVGRREWQIAVEHLSQARLLSECDRSALVAYANAWDVWEMCRRSITVDGLTLGLGLTQKTNPAINAQNQAINVIHKYQQCFGMTPSARAKIKTVPHADADEEKTSTEPLSTRDILRMSHGEGRDVG